MNININTIIRLLFPFIVIAVVAYGISVAFYIYLPKSQDNKITQDSYTLEYNRYSIKNYFEQTKEETIEKKPKKVEKKEYQLLSNINIQAIYAMENNGGFVIISEKGSSATHMLSISDQFKNYTLKEIYPSYVIFEKGSKEYKLTLISDEEKSKTNYIKEPSVSKKALQEKVVEKNDSSFVVEKKLLNSYTSNISKIWKEVKIKEVMKNGKIDGFKIQRISKNSVLNKLGLQKNDILKSVNNIELKSYADAFKIYKQINQIKNLNMIVQRDNQEVEINYELK